MKPRKQHSYRFLVEYIEKYLEVTSGPDFEQVSYNQTNYRFFIIRFNYRFGKLNSEVKKNQHGINNDDIKSGD
jgi:hypothetical protein